MLTHAARGCFSATSQPLCGRARRARRALVRTTPPQNFNDQLNGPQRQANSLGISIGTSIHLTRCLRTLRARLLQPLGCFSHSRGCFSCTRLLQPLCCCFSHSATLPRARVLQPLCGRALRARKALVRASTFILMAACEGLWFMIMVRASTPSKRTFVVDCRSDILTIQLSRCRRKINDGCKTTTRTTPLKPDSL